MWATEGVLMRRILLICSLLACSPVLAQDTMFRGNAEHTGVYSGAGVPQFARIRWQFHTGGQVMSSPAVTADTVYIGSNDHFLHALDRSSGRQKWKFKTESRITSSPAVSGGVVYFGSFDGNFYAVDAAKGALKWKFGIPGERRFTATHIHGSLPAAEAMPDPFDFFPSSPVVWNGAVYFGSGDTNVYALDVASRAAEVEIQDWRRRPCFAGDFEQNAVCGQLGQLFLRAGRW